MIGIMKSFKKIIAVLMAVFLLIPYIKTDSYAMVTNKNVTITPKATSMTIQIKKPNVDYVQIGYGTSLNKASKNADKAKTKRVKSNKTNTFKIKNLKKGTYYCICIKLLKKDSVTHIFKYATTTLGTVSVTKVTPSADKKTSKVKLTKIKKASYRVQVAAYQFSPTSENSNHYKEVYYNSFTTNKNSFVLDRSSTPDLSIVIVRVIASKRVKGKTVKTDKLMDTLFYCTLNDSDGSLLSDDFEFDYTSSNGAPCHYTNPNKKKARP